MPPASLDRLHHILERLSMVRDLLGETTFEHLWDDPTRRAALERHLEVISEASRTIPAEWTSAYPEIPWRRIGDLGNVLRHAYHQTSGPILEQICLNDLGPLEAAIAAMRTAHSS